MCTYGLPAQWHVHLFGGSMFGVQSLVILPIKKSLFELKIPKFQNSRYSQLFELKNLMLDQERGDLGCRSSAGFYNSKIPFYMKHLGPIWQCVEEPSKELLSCRSFLTFTPLLLFQLFEIFFKKKILKLTPNGPPNVKLMRSVLILENDSNSMNYEIFRYFPLLQTID